MYNDVHVNVQHSIIVSIVFFLIGSGLVNLNSIYFYLYRNRVHCKVTMDIFTKQFYRNILFCLITQPLSDPINKIKD